MSVKGSFKVTVLASGKAEGAEMVIRADTITAAPDGRLYVVGPLQKRHFLPTIWKSVTIENDVPRDGPDA